MNIDPSLQKQKNKPPIKLLLSLVVLIAIFVLLIIKLIPLLDENFGTANVASNKTIDISEWEDNTIFMAEVADKLNLKYSDKSLESLSNTVSKIKISDLQKIQDLNLSKKQLTNLPIVLKHFTGLKKLDISNNQLINIPDFLLNQPDLEIMWDYNILPSDRFGEFQFQLYLLDTMKSEYENITLNSEYKKEKLIDIAKNSLWLKATNADGSTVISPLSKEHSFDIMFTDNVDQNNHEFLHYVEDNSNIILREGTISGYFIINGSSVDNSNSRFQFNVNLSGVDKALIPPDSWEGNDVLISHIKELCGVESIESVDKSMLRTISSIKLNDISITSLPNIISEMISLEEIDLSGCSINTLPDMSNLYRLKKINLSSNNIQNIPQSVFSIPNIEYIYLNNNAISNLDISGINKKIQYINASNNELITIPEYIAEYEDLSLDASNNQITSVPETALQKVSSGLWNLNNNILPNQYGNQRYIIIDNLELPPIFTFDKNYSESDIYSTLLKNMKLSDGSPLLGSHKISLGLDNGSSLVGSEYVSTENKVKKNELVTAYFGISNLHDNNPNSKVEIKIKFISDEDSILINNQDKEPNNQNILSEEIITLNVFQDIAKSQEDNDYIYLKSNNNPTISEEAVSYLSKMQKNLYIDMNNNGFEYRCFFQHDKLKKAKNIGLSISNQSEYAEKIKELCDSKNLLIIQATINESLPKSVTVQVHSDNVLANGEAFLYKYNPKKNSAEYVGDALVHNNITTFAINKEADYFITNEPIAGIKISNKINTNESMNKVVIILSSIVVLTIISGLVVLIPRKSYTVTMPQNKLYSKAYNALKSNESGVDPENSQNFVDDNGPKWCPDSIQTAEKISQHNQHDITDTAIDAVNKSNNNKSAGEKTLEEIREVFSNTVIWCNEDSLNYKERNDFMYEEDIEIDIDDL